MTPAERYRENLDLILRLDAFLQECGNYQDRMGIIDEIARLRTENRYLEFKNKTTERVHQHPTVLVLPSENKAHENKNKDDHQTITHAEQGVDAECCAQ